MQLPFNFFDQLREQINISDVVREKLSLSRKGNEFLGLCPFHNEKTPSFTVNDQKRFYHCFGCGSHGDVIGFIAQTSGMSYKESAIKLADKYGIPIPRLTPEQAKLEEETDQIKHVLALANQYFVSQLDNTSKKYLDSRKISEKMIKDYSIGFAPSGKSLIDFLESKKISLKLIHAAGLIGKNTEHDIYAIFRNRITFPIKNIYGKIIAFGGRIIGEGQPKYLNSPETILFKKSDTLYGEDIATSSAYQKKRIIVVEGYLDVIAMHNAGFTETVATLGTAVTASHLAKLWRVSDEIIFCMDGDSAGQKSMQKAILTVLPLMKNQQKVSFLVLPNGIDPDDAVNNLGPKYIDDLLEKRMSLSEMIWHLETTGKNFPNPESKSILESTLEEYVSFSINSSLAKYMLSEFKSKIWSLGRKKKHSHISNLSPITNISDPLTIILYNIFALVLKNSSILDDQNIYEKFVDLDFENNALDNIRTNILEIYNDKGKLDIEELTDIVRNTSFFDIFVLLLSCSTQFIDKLSLENRNINSKDLWHLWLKRYECEILKKEYTLILSGVDNDKNFDKARHYMTQILRVENELKTISEEMFG